MIQISYEDGLSLNFSLLPAPERVEPKNPDVNHLSIESNQFLCHKKNRMHEKGISHTGKVVNGTSKLITEPDANGCEVVKEGFYFYLLPKS